MSDPLRPAPEPEPVRFHLWQLLYATALIGAGLANFGWWGLASAAGTLVFWGFVFVNPWRARTVGWLVAFVLAWACLAAFLTHSHSRPLTDHRACVSRMSDIRLALEAYRAKNGSYPPPYLADASGKPMHSWRVLILPYLVGPDLYRTYRFDEPWDGPHNIKLLDSMPHAYRCPNQEDAHQTHTSYVVVTGPRTLFPTDGTKVAAVPDAPDLTVILLERGTARIPWTSPEDVGLDAAIEMVLHPEAIESESGHIRTDFRVTEHDGPRLNSLRGGILCFPQDLPREDAERLFRIDDGSPLGVDEHDMFGSFYWRTEWNSHNFVKLGVLILLTILPLPWVFLYPEWPVPPVRPTPPPEPTIPTDLDLPRPDESSPFHVTPK